MHVVFLSTLYKWINLLIQTCKWHYNIEVHYTTIYRHYCIDTLDVLLHIFILYRKRVINIDKTSMWTSWAKAFCKTVVLYPIYLFLWIPVFTFYLLIVILFIFFSYFSMNTEMIGCESTFFIKWYHHTVYCLFRGSVCCIWSHFFPCSVHLSRTCQRFVSRVSHRRTERESHWVDRLSATANTVYC